MHGGENGCKACCLVNGQTVRASLAGQQAALTPAPLPTPAALLAFFLVLSTLFERSTHWLIHFLKRRKRNGLAQAVSNLVNELTLVRQRCGACCAVLALQHERARRACTESKAMDVPWAAVPSTGPMRDRCPAPLPPCLQVGFVSLLLIVLQGPISSICGERGRCK